MRLWSYKELYRVHSALLGQRASTSPIIDFNKFLIFVFFCIEKGIVKLIHLYFKYVSNGTKNGAVFFDN